MTAGGLTRGEVYLLAADLIETRGKADGRYSDDECLCVVGAIRVAIFGRVDNPSPDDPRIDLYLGALVHLGAYLRGIGNLDCLVAGVTVVGWSDRSSAEHVVATLRAAAASVVTS
jgi:hypothetical protein